MSNRNQKTPQQSSRGDSRPATGGEKRNTSAPANPLMKKVQATPAPVPTSAPVAPTTPATPSGSVCKLSDVRFADMNLTGPTGRAIKEVFGFEYMTPVQAATLPDIQKGMDVLAKARTGTGKTLGFLVPQADMLSVRPPKSASAIEVLVIAPTRELALQIEQEAVKLYTFHQGSKIVSVIGGRPMPKEVRALAGRIDVLVATPGRLLDHLKNTNGFAARLQNLRCVVFDECDQLMDMGFARDIDAIMSYCPPKEKRQTLLFSATIPAAISQLANKYCRTNVFKTIDCVQDEPATHKHVSQTYIRVPFLRQLPMLYVLLQSLKQNKAIVFFQTARAAQLAAEMLANTPLAKTQQYFEIHSRRSQSQRTKAQQGFAETPLTTPCVLLSSDASARGVDYPGVELVVQVGAPTDKEQYIHRLGRTARAGKQGTGILLADENESWLINQLTAKTSGIDIIEDPNANALLDAADTVLPVVHAAIQRVSVQTRSQAYQAWLGYFNSSLGKMKWTKNMLTLHANTYAKEGLLYPAGKDGQWLPPALQKKTIGKMGLKGTPGLHIENERFPGQVALLPSLPLRKSDGKIPVLNYSSGSTGDVDSASSTATPSAVNASKTTAGAAAPSRAATGSKTAAGANTSAAAGGKGNTNTNSNTGAANASKPAAGGAKNGSVPASNTNTNKNANTGAGAVKGEKGEKKNAPGANKAAVSSASAAPAAKGTATANAPAAAKSAEKPHTASTTSNPTHSAPNTFSHGSTPAPMNAHVPAHVAASHIPTPVSMPNAGMGPMGGMGMGYNASQMAGMPMAHPMGYGHPMGMGAVPAGVPVNNAQYSSTSMLPSPAVIAAQMSVGTLQSVLNQQNISTQGMSHAQMQQAYISLYKEQYQRYVAQWQQMQQMQQMNTMGTGMGIGIGIGAHPGVNMGMGANANVPPSMSTMTPSIPMPTATSTFASASSVGNDEDSNGEDEGNAAEGEDVAPGTRSKRPRRPRGGRNRNKGRKLEASQEHA